MTIADIVSSASGESATFRKGLASILRNECEYEHDGLTIRLENVPGDSGGMTFAGIDQASHPEFDFQNPTPKMVWQTYKDHYFKPLRCAEFPTPLSVISFVQSVNQGVASVARLIQLALNDYGCRLVIDGDVGDQTLKAAWACPDSFGLAAAFLAKSKRHYAEIISRIPRDEKFLKGWNNRIEDLRSEFLT